MKTARNSQLALAFAILGTLAAPAPAHAGWFSGLFQADSDGTPQFTDTYNNHVDAKKQDMAPHANALFFMQPGSLPQESWEKLSPEQRDAYARRMEIMKRETCGVPHPVDGRYPHPHDGMAPPPEAYKHHGHGDKAMHDQRMEKRRAEWEKMTPAERDAAKKRWEARRAEWEKMTPAEREAAKQRWHQKHDAPAQ